MSERPWQALTVIFEGTRYRILRRPGLVERTVEERWPGRGIVASERLWLGYDYSERLRWYAAINPACEPFRALERVDNLTSRRAAIRWLLARASGQKP
jgi:hypothetical protein